MARAKVERKVPDDILVAVYRTKWPRKRPGIGSDSIESSPTYKEEFMALLPARYRNVDPAYVAKRLTRLRRSGHVGPVCGRKGPTPGFAMSAYFEDEVKPIFEKLVKKHKKAGTKISRHELLGALTDG